MKKALLVIELYLLRGMMSFIYFFIKLFPMQKNRVVMISRQSNNINIDFKLLQEKLIEDKNIKVKILCKILPKDLWGKFKYCFFIIKCMYYLSISRVCFVDGYVIPVCALKHKKKLIIIQVWHAMGAIKKFGKQILNKKEGSKEELAKIMKMHQNYTYITCTSNKTKEFYSEAFATNLNKILVLGMPRVDYLLDENKEIISNIKEQYPYLKERKTILYVPTFRKGKKSHVDDVISKVDTKKYNLIVRLHPLERNEIDEKYIIDNKYSTMDLLKISDYIITDYSAIAIEAVVLNKPVFFYLYDIKEYEENRGLNINLKEEMPDFTCSSICDIINKIDNEDYQMNEIKQFREKYVETANKNNTEQIVNYVLNIMKEEN